MTPRTALACTLLMLTFPRLAAQEPDKEPWKYHEPFRGNPHQAKDFTRLGTDAAQCVKYEDQGLRITLPAGKSRPTTGVGTTFGLKGDFDVSVRYEILHEPEPADAGQSNTGTRISLTVKLDETYEAAIRRKITPEQPVHILTWRRMRPPGATKDLNNGAIFPVKEKSGRLRLERRGTELSYYHSDGDMEFKLLTTFPFVADDIQSIQRFGETSGPKAALDARFSDLHITATSPPPLPAVRPIERAPRKAEPIAQPIEPAPKFAVPAAAPPAETSRRTPFSLYLVLGGVLALLTAIVMGLMLMLFLRWRKQSE